MAKLEIVKDDNGKPVGYDLIQEDGESEEFATIRNMLFFGYGNDLIKYAGRESKPGRDNEYTGDSVERLTFRTERFKWERRNHER